MSPIFGGNEFESSPGVWAATAASYCPSRPGELQKLIATEYRTQGAEPPCSENLVELMTSLNNLSTNYPRMALHL